jgi:hypothetical protein
MGQAGAQHSLSPVDAVVGGDETPWNHAPSWRCSILLTSEKVNVSEARRNAQPWNELCVHLCGHRGYSVSPPSCCNGGTYELLGDVSLKSLLAKRNLLPTIQGLDSLAYLSEPQRTLADLSSWKGDLASFSANVFPDPPPRYTV